MAFTATIMTPLLVVSDPKSLICFLDEAFNLVTSLKVSVSENCSSLRRVCTSKSVCHICLHGYIACLVTKNHFGLVPNATRLSGWYVQSTFQMSTFSQHAECLNGM